MGLDPAAPVPHNLYQAIPRNLNKELRAAWTYWEWPYIEYCDERAFQRIWNDYEQFVADEKVICIRDMAYYQALDTPPIGTPPTDPAYWEPLVDYGSYIPFQQICRRPMGMVIGVYPSDPRAKGCSCQCGSYYRPLANGIEVLGGHGPTVFVKYQVPVPRFTLTPYAPGRNYSTGNILYESNIGECFIAIVPSVGVAPPNPTAWLQLQFPDFLEDYVVAATYGACIKETSQGVGEDPESQKMRFALAKDAKADADDALESEIHKLVAMGQRYHYAPWSAGSGRCFVRPPPGVCLSEPFDPTGGSLPPELQPPVTTLSEICETDATIPVPHPTAKVRWEYRHKLVALLTADGTPSLAGIPTKGIYELGSLLLIVIMPRPGTPEQAQEWRFEPEAADPADPGEVAPDDYDPAFNNVHWERV